MSVNGESASRLKVLLAEILKDDKAAQILKQRAKALARQEKPAEDSEKKNSYLCFSLGNEMYCLPVEAVEEIQPVSKITPIPSTPVWYEGVMNVRGSILPVVGLAELLGLKAKLNTKSQVVIVNYKNYKLCFLTGGVKGLQEINEKELKVEESLAGLVNEEFIKGVAENQYIVLNINSLLQSPKLVVNEEVVNV